MLPAAVDGGNPQGSVVIATLESALAAFNSQEESAVFETPAGKVTVVKLEKIGQSDQSLVFTFSASGGESNNDSSSLLLHLPAFLIADAEAGGYHYMYHCITQADNSEFKHVQDIARQCNCS